MKVLGDDELVMVLVSKIVFAETNPNHMDDDEYRALKDGIAAGADMPDPLLVSPNPDGTFEVVDGEHRVRAVRDLYPNEDVELPAVVRDWTAEQRAAWRVGLNGTRGALRLRVVRQVAEVFKSDPKLLTVSGFTGARAHLLDPPAVKALDLGARSGAAEVDDGDEPAPVSARPFVLEVPFASRQVLQRVRRALKKAGGKDKDIARGLLNVLGLDTEHT